MVLPEGVQGFLDPMPLNVLRGVGAKTARRLQRAGIVASRKLRRNMVHRLRLAAERGDEAFACCRQSYRGLILCP